ncbi:MULTISPECIES: alpha/beta hydrolase fold domain-containing protein [unclassified Pseudomonas]|uniref:alpha/beta hydrolase fold domain-containing protein n=1 Tax=unclassified Pseudomonas TaxID=196821 RepID=UPI00244AACBF|nr:MULTISPECIES: alpha/beta hydrolase fold domain-containing protein [unclassified Pseudomonas]MDG9923348.1 alpha/beta hydrolase fold domain-containing protein [Pseudomonas sp. GD04045]MDH0037551.1 alpha/beta hydrolase fold domain-containing protein [Pseudomonas sp. GD04019]
MRTRLALLLSLCVLSPAALACTPQPLTAEPAGDTVRRNLCYGEATWNEPTLEGEPLLEQVFDYFPLAGATPAPLVIWAHPNGKTKWLKPGSEAYLALVQQAHDQGFAFVSLEFRHPVSNEDIVPVPHRDIAQAIQFIRANAEALGVDPDNLFLVGQSRGSLGLWTALQNDMADPGSDDQLLQQSTRVNAVFAYQGQTTYDGREFADLFLIEADRRAAKAKWKKDHPQYALFGSAIRSVGDDDPPVLLRYAHPFVGRPLSAREMARQDSLHYPDMGPALCAAYAQAFGDNRHCSAQDNVPAGQAFDGYAQFFRQYLR